jgi:Protein of unknown function (DUF3489)
MTGTKVVAPSSDEATATRAQPGQGKIAAVRVPLEAGRGATLDDLVAATGWLPHTARAVLSGLKKKGHTIDRQKVDGVSRYRIKGVAD